MPAQPPPTPPLHAETFDLRRLPDADQDNDFHVLLPNCAPGETGEIVVCAQNRARNRLEKLPGETPPKEGLPPARLNLGGGKTLGVTTESSAMGGGATSKRIMVTGTIKF